MFLDDNPDYQTVWQLAHIWVDAEPDETDTSAISPKLREHIIRLMLAIRNRKISARTRKRSIFIDDSIISLIADIPHYLKTLNCLLKDAINKAYLDSLYVKREEVIDLCIRSHYDPPSCWMPKHLPDGQIITKEAKNYRPANEIEDRIRCQAIASALWELDSTIHPIHIVRSKIIQQIGNGRTYDDETVKEWIKNVDPQKKRKKGAPPKVQYKIELIKDPQLED
ncbi:hypothetical protein W03_20090 [Nitrosomonas sp. PY1]|uniref:hypothetical protein n=1 Tax=Nitrosomonas sp. PY1 TaxID=1803906 RepID=UPI001FC81D98|nr:hypothetical protein [Nitrosomonas sp. PY1]GKS70005.1 hypothetical protein W03_20090 [Nitrosomonas sp. PY1]